MAITSISRIQHRRGKANSGYGLPQLASGELGWAIDTQELYIGNGSVAEGAPFVGNTRILTEIDMKAFTGNSGISIFGKLDYRYKAGGSIVGIMIMNGGGTGYADGTYNNVQLVWGPEFIGTEPLSLPTATITVADGSVVYVNIQNPGYGITIGSQFTVTPFAIGDGSGFYIYVSALSGPNTPYERAVTRTVQSRLDDRVNSTDFGTVGDGFVDDTAALQDAINQLYLNIPGIQTVYGTIFTEDGEYKTILTANATNEMVGGLIDGPGIPPLTVILSVIPGVSIIMSQASTSLDPGIQIFAVKLQLDNLTAYTNPLSRVTLEIPPGTYRISDTLYIPSFATIVGSGLNGSIIKYQQSFNIVGSIQTGSNTLHTNSASLGMVGAAVLADDLDPSTYVVSVDRDTSTSQSNDWVLTLNTTYAGTQEFVRNFTVILLEKDTIIEFVNDTSVPGTPGAFEDTTAFNQPRNITLKNISIETQSLSQTVLKLNAVRDSLFENIKISGAWTTDTFESCIAIGIYSKSLSIGSNNNLFKNVNINQFYFPVLLSNDCMNNKFSEGSISDSYYGFMIGNPSFIGNGVLVDGPSNISISDYTFTDIITQAVFLDTTENNTIKDCILTSVGYDDVTLEYTPQLYSFSKTNLFENINTDRTAAFMSSTIQTPYVPELAGHGIFYSFNQFTKNIVYNTEFTNIFRLPVSTDSDSLPSGTIIHEIDYEYESENNFYLRRGNLKITISVDNSLIQFVDDYDFIGNEDFNMYLEFNVILVNESGAPILESDTPFTVVVQYKNILVNDIGKLTFSFKSTS